MLPIWLFLVVVAGGQKRQIKKLNSTIFAPLFPSLSAADHAPPILK
jgi:hypothetical protein